MGKFKHHIAIIGMGLHTGVHSALHAQLADKSVSVTPSAPKHGKTEMLIKNFHTDLPEIKLTELRRSVIPAGHFKSVYNKKRGKFNDY